MSDPTGHTAAPAHYEGERETIDKQRDLARAMGRALHENLHKYTPEVLGDLLFAAHCRLTVLKYEDRMGRKSGTDDRSKRRWYLDMYNHVRIPQLTPDPRHTRPDFEPYEEMR